MEGLLSMNGASVLESSEIERLAPANSAAVTAGPVKRQIWTADGSAFRNVYIEGDEFVHLFSSNRPLDLSSFPDIDVIGIDELDKETFVVRLHWIVLCFASPVLKEALFAAMQSTSGESANLTIIMPDVSRTLLNDLISFIYNGMAFGPGDCCLQLQQLLHDLQIGTGDDSDGSGIQLLSAAAVHLPELAPAPGQPYSRFRRCNPADMQTKFDCGTQTEVIAIMPSPASKGKQRTTVVVNCVEGVEQSYENETGTDEFYLPVELKEEIEEAIEFGEDKFVETDYSNDDQAPAEDSDASWKGAAAPSARERRLSLRRRPQSTAATAQKKKKKLKCNKCAETFFSKHKLKKHQLTHTCPLCAFVCRGQVREKMRKHYAKQHPNVVFRHSKAGASAAAGDATAATGGHECQVCGTEFKKVADLVAHKNSFHEKLRNFECKYCSKQLTTRKNWRAHVKSTHEKAEKFSCILCPFSTIHKKRLLLHMKVKHLEEIRRNRAKQKLDGDLETTALRHFLESSDGKSLTADLSIDLKTLEDLEVPKTDKKLKCSLCDKDFTNISSFYLHQRRVHLKLKRFMCDKCPYSSFTAGSMKEHNRTHSGEKPYKCTYCGYASSYRDNLRRHIITHTGDKPFKCEQCPYSASQMACLKAHVLKHSGERPYKCSHCSYSTRDKDYIKTHELYHLPLAERALRVTTGKRSYTCKLCPYVGPTKAHFDKHSVRHVEEREFKCNLCTYSSAHPASLKAHLDLHQGIVRLKRRSCAIRYVMENGERVYKCKQCSYSTKSASSLNTHEFTHTGEKPYKCDQCSYSARQSHHLKTHKLQHTGEKPFKCSVCSYSGRNITNLNQHMFTHTAEKPLKCYLCSFATSDKRILRTHIFKHTGVHPYRCEVCSFSTVGLREFNRHKLTHDQVQVIIPDNSQLQQQQMNTPTMQLQQQQLTPNEQLQSHTPIPIAVVTYQQAAV